MSELRTRTKQGRTEAINVIQQQAIVDGKATDTYMDPETGLKERFTYITKNGRVELAEVWTNAEEVYPPFTDKKGRRIRY